VAELVLKRQQVKDETRIVNSTQPKV